MGDSGGIIKRVTLSDVARVYGCHGTTVGLALRNHPSLPEKTCKRIQALALEMGYRPDPALQSLVAHRKGRMQHKGFSTIAVISDRPTADGWHKGHPTGEAYFEGMTERAEALGYKLDEFTVLPDHSHAQHVDRILRARSLTAVIVAPLHNQSDPIQLNWPHYCVISLGFSLHKPVLPCVDHQHRTGTQMAVENLIDLGYRRLALINSVAVELRVEQGWSAGFYGAVHLNEDRVKGFALISPKITDLCCPEVLDWIRQKKPEVVMTAEYRLYNYLREAGFKIPEEIGFVQLDRQGNMGDVAGIDQNSRAIGAETVSFISLLQTANIRGVPALRNIHLIRGRWVMGETVRQIRPGPKPPVAEQP